MTQVQPDRYTARIKALTSWMADENINAIILHDTEGQRTSSIRYLCGHPMDALFFIFAEGESVLVPWDINLAEKLACASTVIPQTEFNRDIHLAIAQVLESRGCTAGSRVEISSSTPYPDYLEIAARVQCELICRTKGLDDRLLHQRMIKDRNEITLYRMAGHNTSLVFDSLAESWDSFGSEADVAFFIEREGRAHGAEGMGFETIVAGPSRSWGIHAFPSFGMGSLRDTGLSIVDLGLIFDGYTTDITTTVVRGRITSEQEKMCALVQEASDRAVSMLSPGIPVNTIAGMVSEFFTSKSRQMPHSLGHGIGLDAHEYPYLRDRADNSILLTPGMVITIEPGLYNPAEGGVRLENDFLITDTGFEQLTTSRILRIP